MAVRFCSYADRVRIQCKLRLAWYQNNVICTVAVLTLFDMGIFEPSVNFVVIALMIMKFGTDVKRDVFYTMVTKNCDVTTITSL